MGTGLAWTNATVAFGLELAALAVLGRGGWQLGGPPAVRIVLAVVLPIVAAVLWSLFAAPRAAPSAAGRLAVQALCWDGGRCSAGRPRRAGVRRSLPWWR